MKIESPSFILKLTVVNPEKWGRGPVGWVPGTSNTSKGNCWLSCDLKIWLPLETRDNSHLVRTLIKTNTNVYTIEHRVDCILAILYSVFCQFSIHYSVFIISIVMDCTYTVWLKTTYTMIKNFIHIWCTSSMRSGWVCRSHRLGIAYQA